MSTRWKEVSFNPMEEKYKILEDMLHFLPKSILSLAKKHMLFDLIITGQVQDSAALYEHVPEWMLAFQDSDYSELALSLHPLLQPGAVLEIGCGQGDLMRRLAILGVKPLYGIDRSLGMVKAARNNLEEFEEIEVFHSKAEDYNFSPLGPLANVIMNNFWGLLPTDTSFELLSNLREHLAPNGKIIIGDCKKEIKPDYVLEAERKAAAELNFVISYPLFMDFENCGFHSELVPLAGGEFCVLTPSRSSEE
jgi:SAM-dependent methyltransferase